MNIYKPKGEEREWRSVSMSIRLDAELNYLLEKQIWKNGGTKQKVVKLVLESVLKDSELFKKLINQ